jgi:hypothetical protein
LSLVFRASAFWHDIGHVQKEEFLDETIDPEKTAERRKNISPGATDDQKETASSIADAARPAAEAAWNDAKRRLATIAE